MVESRDLSLMAKLWYDPETLTPALEPEQKLYLAYVGEELVGGIIVTPVTPNTLFTIMAERTNADARLKPIRICFGT